MTLSDEIARGYFARGISVGKVKQFIKDIKEELRSEPITNDEMKDRIDKLAGEELCN